MNRVDMTSTSTVEPTGVTGANGRSTGLSAAELRDATDKFMSALRGAGAQPGAESVEAASDRESRAVAAALARFDEKYLATELLEGAADSMEDTQVLAVLARRVLPEPEASRIAAALEKMAAESGTAQLGGAIPSGDGEASLNTGFDQASVVAAALRELASLPGGDVASGQAMGGQATGGAGMTPGVVGAATTDQQAAAAGQADADAAIGATEYSGPLGSVPAGAEQTGQVTTGQAGPTAVDGLAPDAGETAVPGAAVSGNPQASELVGAQAGSLGEGVSAQPVAGGAVSTTAPLDGADASAPLGDASSVSAGSVNTVDSVLADSGEQVASDDDAALTSPNTPSAAVAAGLVAGGVASAVAANVPVAAASETTAGPAATATVGEARPAPVGEVATGQFPRSGDNGQSGQSGQGTQAPQAPQAAQDAATQSPQSASAVRTDSTVGPTPAPQTPVAAGSDADQVPPSGTGTHATAASPAATTATPSAVGGAQAGVAANPAAGSVAASGPAVNSAPGAAVPERVAAEQPVPTPASAATPATPTTPVTPAAAFGAPPSSAAVPGATPAPVFVASTPAGSAAPATGPETVTPQPTAGAQNTGLQAPVSQATGPQTTQPANEAAVLGGQSASAPGQPGFRADTARATAPSEPLAALRAPEPQVPETPQPSTEASRPVPPPAPQPAAPALAPSPLAQNVQQPVTAPTATNPSAPAPPPMASTAPVPPIYQQLITGMTPMLRGVDGTYALMMQLNPATLGQVRIAVQVKNGEASIQVKAVDGNTRDLVQDNLDDLRSTLEKLGVSAGSIDVDIDSGDAEAFAGALEAEDGDSSQVTTGGRAARAAEEAREAAAREARADDPTGAGSDDIRGTYGADGRVDVRA